MGIGGLVLDVTTFGTGTVVKGATKTGVKSAINGTRNTVADSTQQAVKQTPRTQAKHANATSGNNHPAQVGKEVHNEFKQGAADRGWDVKNTTLRKDGKVLRPDAIDDCGRPVELKPNTKRGRQRGKSQAKKYTEATERETVIIYYNPITKEIIWP